MIVRYFVLVALSLVLSFSTGMAQSQAHAGWKFWERTPKVQGPTMDKGHVVPPPKDYREERCEPYRQEVRDNNQGSWVTKPGVYPANALNKARHYKCLDRFNAQEKAYLENEIPGPTESDGTSHIEPLSLPVIPSAVDTPSSANSASTAPQVIRDTYRP